ncbi:restriction endonuclease subunit S [Bacteroides caecimuris]|uniref:restriction endonuclease subunit S n=1 Tax=Bacteroides caecimuris TaxID=1796613 RepID=UPI002573A38E|nr:restriction endonuclease subunit S [Bacteroides caecimuris]
MRIERSNWEQRTLGEFFDLQMGKTPSRKDLSLWEDGDTPWVSISDMKESRYISDTKEHLPYQTIAECRIPIIPVGTVIMSFKLTIGKTCIVSKPLTTNEAIMAFYPKKGIEVNSSFLAYALSALKWKGNRAVKGVTINKKTISEKNFSLPPIGLQDNIAAELDAIQEVIDGYKDQIADLDALAQSIFLETFGDPISNPKGWKTELISKFGRIVTGNTPSRAISDYYNSQDIEWIKTDNIVKDLLTPTTAYEYLSFEGAKKGRIVKSGSILICCIAGSLQSIGRCCLTDRSLAFNQQINAIKCDVNHIPLFVYCLIKASQQLLIDTASTGMKHILSKSDLSSICLPVPPLELQQQFANKIASIEQQKDLLRQQLADAEMLMAERMQYYFS